MKSNQPNKTPFAPCLIIAITSATLIFPAEALPPPVDFPSLRVGDGNGNGTFVAEGKYYYSPLLDSAYQTEGSRMLWYPRKSAFRAGYGSADNWNEATMGYSSVAMGIRNTASGEGSVALGLYNTASGEGSVALGYGNHAIGDGSTALGRYNTASGEGSTALGFAGIASAQYSVSLGSTSIASGWGSTAMGSWNTASGGVSTTMGNSNTASGELATVMGFVNTASSFAETVIGTYNASISGNPAAWSANDPVFQIGNGHRQMDVSEQEDGFDYNDDGQISPYPVYLPETYSNALTVYKSGNMELQRNLTVGGSITSAGVPVLTRGQGAIEGSFALGYSFASGFNSIAIGYVTTASGDYSAATGWGTSATGDYSRASGNGTLASGFSSTTSGTGSIASGSNSFSNGLYTSATSSDEAVFGRFNLQSAPIAAANNVHGLDGLFRLGNGNGTGSAQRSDAMTVLNNGQTTLTNKTWKSRNALAVPATADPSTSDTTDSGGNALVVDGHTVLNGKVTIAVPQGDISMGNYQ